VTHRWERCEVVGVEFYRVERLSMFQEVLRDLFQTAVLEIGYFH
jgi:hypothetical protein